VVNRFTAGHHRLDTHPTLVSAALVVALIFLHFHSCILTHDISDPMASCGERPTLPPLRSLRLPIPTLGQPTLPSIDEYFDAYNDHMPLNISRHCQNRHSTIPSMLAPSPRTPSPTLSPLTTVLPRATSSPIPRISTPQKWRLIPSSLDTADAVVLYPPPDTPSILGSNFPKTKDGALFLVGDALKHIRLARRRIAKGARIHPFKMVRKDGGRRRSSVSSTLSS
jgi:hypothetical protein